MNTLSTLDPVCGREIEPGQSAGKSEYRGVVYYFCSLGCQAMFEDNMARYVEPGKGVPEPEQVPAS